MYYVYILYSAQKDKYYVGQTDNIATRLASHKSGISKYTSMVKDWILVYSEEYMTREQAIKRELEIKKKKSRAYIESLFK